MEFSKSNNYPTLKCWTCHSTTTSPIFKKPCLCIDKGYNIIIELEYTLISMAYGIGICLLGVQKGPNGNISFCLYMHHSCACINKIRLAFMCKTYKPMKKSFSHDFHQQIMRWKVYVLSFITLLSLLVTTWKMFHFKLIKLKKTDVKLKLNNRSYNTNEL